MGIETLFKSKWLEVKKKNLPNGSSYVYSHAVWCQGEGVAVLPFKKDGFDLRFLGRFEVCPAHSDEVELCSITGGMDVEGESPVFTAKRELLEEGGFNIAVEKFVYLGDIQQSKASDTVTHLFAVNITGKEQGEILGDGTSGEEGAYSDWITMEELSDSKDPILHAMLLRATAKGILE